MLALFSDYPGDPTLQAYLKCAIQAGLLSGSTFIRTFLMAAGSAFMRHASTLDMLCKTVLDCKYDPSMNCTGASPFPSGPPSIVSDSVRYGMALLKIACELPPAHYHELTTSASHLLLLLLGTVSDLVAAQFTRDQIVNHIADARDLASQPKIPPDMKQMLEGFALLLSSLLGDDEKVAGEAQIIQSTVETRQKFGRGETAAPSSHSDIVSCSLVLGSLVRFVPTLENRNTEFCR